MVPRDPHRILGVPPDATLEQIEEAYRRLAKRYHPDHNKRPDANETMAEINWAYDVLKRASAPPRATPPTRTSRRPNPRRAPGNRVLTYLTSIVDEPFAHPWVLIAIGLALAYFIYMRFPASIEPPRNPGDLAFSGALTSVAEYFHGSSLTASPVPSSLSPAAMGTPRPPGDFASDCVSALTASRYAGKHICVYGRVNRVAYADGTFEVEFIESGGRLVARSAAQSWSDLKVRDCAAIDGLLREDGERLIVEIDFDGVGRCP